VELLIQRLGIMGGTFDPIHDGHLVAAGEAWQQLALDRVLFVPAGQPPHKPLRPITAAHHRLRMIELAIEGKPHFGVSRADVDRPGPCYTADLLRLLRADWGPAPTFFFIVGGDSLIDLVNWYRPHEIIAQTELAVVKRPGVDIDVDSLNDSLPGIAQRLHWFTMPGLEISSSTLRQRVREGRPISYLVPRQVEAHIQEQHLYLLE
jgi:nicotinate-nucleotide adenylyltransferase